MPVGLPLLRRRLRAAPLPRGGPGDAAGRGAEGHGGAASGSGSWARTRATTPASIRLTCFIGEAGGTFSPSSLRVDAITPRWRGRMAAGGERSITLAPEAGTERMRRVVNKDFTDDRIVQAAEDALDAGHGET